MNTRIEILTEKGWERLKLRDGTSIKYNKVINRIGDLSNRQISHTHTFELPKIHNNTSILGINEFNRSDLAKAFNRKYEAKYYVEDRVLQEGFLIINNTRDDFIKVNFIDTSLGIIDQWGTTTFYELLQADNPLIPADYVTAIDEMKNYNLDKNSIVTPLSEVGTRGYNLSLFPNSLNTVGDLFNLQDDGNRYDKTYNPYQSRPIFNAKSLFDLACYSYGYTPFYDDSVNWDLVAENYMVRGNMDEPEKVENINSEELVESPPFFDEFNQYIDEDIDLTRFVPDKTIKELLIGLMAKDGILMDINVKTKVIKFFSYSTYSPKSVSGEFSNWSTYLIPNEPYNYNMDYGSNFAKDNLIGLKDPFSGNEYKLTLENQGAESKLKDFAESRSKIFSDITSINFIDNSITPYKEFSTDSLALVHHASDLATLIQQKIGDTDMGAIVGVPLIGNVSFLDLPSGLLDWYTSVDESVKAEPLFLLPIDVVKNVDLSEPVYIRELMGFWIIEEIAEYENSQTPVVVKLIRMINAAEYNTDYNDDYTT